MAFICLFDKNYTHEQEDLHYPLHVHLSWKFQACEFESGPLHLISVERTAVKAAAATAKLACISLVTY